MRPEQMKRIAAAASAGFAMPITAQTDEAPQFGDEMPAPADGFLRNEGPVIYQVGDVRLPMLETDDSWDRLPGEIRIGGDRGDIIASGASNYDDGVTLHGVVLRTRMRDLPPAAIQELVEHIVYPAFESIGPEAFRPQGERRASRFAQVDGSPFNADWSRRMLDDLREDQRISDMVQDVGEENVVPTPEQSSKIEDLKAMFPEAMDFSTPDRRDLEYLDSGYEGDEDALSFGGPSLNTDERPDENWDPDGPISLSSNSVRLIRIAAHLDSLGLHDAADDLDAAAMAEIENLLESLPEITAGRGRGMGRGRGRMDGTGPRGGTDECPLSEDDDLDVESRRRLHLRGPRGTRRDRRGPGTGPRAQEGTCPLIGKPIKASVRTAQAQLAEVGLDEDDVDLDAADDQAQIVSFDPERGNMIVKAPDGLFKLYEITGVGPGGKPRFELGGILDSPDDRVDDYTSHLMRGNPSLEGYGGHLPQYLNQLMGGNPGIQQAYGGPV